MGLPAILLGGVVLVALLLFWKKILAWLPTLWKGKVTTAISTASDAVTDAVTVAAEQTLATVTTAQPVVTLDSIAAKLIALESKVYSGETSKPPAASAPQTGA